MANRTKGHGATRGQSVRQARRGLRADGKPLLRGWFHAFAAAGAVAVTAALALRTWGDPARFVSVLVFGISMVELYTMSAVYHLGHWRERTRVVLRSLDHANIFVLIAGTYTPISVMVLDGALSVGVLAVIWLLASAGIATAVFTIRLPRWATAGLYVGMGWVSLVPAPELVRLLTWGPVLTMALGGMLYTLGAVVYSLKRPNPFPRVFGFHEVFHLFVIAGSVAFVAAIWVWVLPYPA